MGDINMQTKELKQVCEIFSNVIKCNKLRPITDFIEIYSKDGIAHLGMTDNRTIITATISNSNDIDNAVISLRDLYRLVKLVQDEETTLTNKGKYVEIKTSGKYKLPIQVDETGNDIDLELDMPEMEKVVEYNSEDFKQALERNKVGVFTGDTHDEFQLYYNTGDKLVTTDSIVLACTKDLKLPLENIQPFVIEQLANFKGIMSFSEVAGGYRISCSGFEVYMVNKLYEKFPIEMVSSFLNEDDFSEMFPITVKVDKSELVNAIKRQDVFKSMYEVPTVIFDITDRVTIKNTKDTVEDVLVNLLPHVDIEMKVRINTKILLDVLKNMGSDILLRLGKQAVCLQDDIGFYIVAVVDGE